jgi:hypothetical protein
VAGDHEGRTLEGRIGKRLAEFLDGRCGVLADRSRIVVELDFEIDPRLRRGEVGDLGALAKRERSGGPVAQTVDETAFSRPGRGIGRGASERPRVTGFGCSAFRIRSAVTVSPAIAKPAESDRAAASLIAVKPENLERLVMVVIPRC